jgi:hypothetical protein
MTKDEALKLALAFIEAEGWGDSEVVITAINEALAQPAQEPWRESASDYERGVIDGRQMQAQSSVDKAVNAMTRRTWVGLTDEDCTGMSAGDKVVAMWAEAKLKEKNA